MTAHIENRKMGDGSMEQGERDNDSENDAVKKDPTRTSVWSASTYFHGIPYRWDGYPASKRRMMQWREERRPGR